MTILVAGVGNIFLGDDAFGVEVAKRLSEMDLPNHVRVVDYGIRGMHLAYDLAGTTPELTIIVDATTQGDPPGTVNVIDLAIPSTMNDQTLLDAHGMQPDVVLGLVQLLGATPGRVLLVGCEPQDLTERMALSPAVEQAVDTAVEVVTKLITKYPFTSDKELTCALASLAK
jgi:hydrogenase maturation protease